jgi:hypothetical protein
VSGLGRLLDMLLDALAAILAIADLNGVTMIAKINARSLSGIITMDVEYFGNAWCNAIGRLLIDLAYCSGEGRHRPPTGKNSLVKPSTSVSLTEEVR